MRTNLNCVVSLFAVLVAGSCAQTVEPSNHPEIFADGAANHPIAVGPSYASLKVPLSAPANQLSAEDATRMSGFVADYLSRGNGSLTVTVPRGPSSTDEIEVVSEHLVDMGVPRARLSVGTRDAADNSVELGYVAYVAHTDTCGDWSKDADDSADNVPMPDFGCAVQHNVAAMVADPRDLVTPRTMTPADAARRATLMKQYETGKATSAEKTQEQSGAVSGVASTGGSSQ